MTQHKIVSGETPVVGLRVLTNEYKWGTITALGKGRWDIESSEYGTMDTVPCGTYCEAWHEVTYEDGRRQQMNCDRLTTREPRRLG